MKWEYLTKLWRWKGTWEDDLDKFLNFYGGQGWEVVTCQPEQNTVRILFKRPAPMVSGEDAYR